MAYRKIALASLVVNPANDRHGELENETAAIAQLFATQELHMRNLARDLVSKGEVFEPPLVFPSGDKFIVADGNRRTTCLKLLAAPRRAPTVELQQFFAEQRKKWAGKFPDKIECRVEADRDRVDDILYRRHTGVQGGIGQSTWTDRMKNNFVQRTGKGTGLNVADEIEKLLKAAKLLPTRKIPRSNLNRLLSAEALRNRVGISVRKGKLSIGVQTGPPIGAQKGPPFQDGARLIGHAPLRCARRREGGARPEARAAQSILIPVCSGDQFRFLKRQLSLPVSMMSQ